MHFIRLCIMAKSGYCGLCEGRQSARDSEGISMSYDIIKGDHTLIKNFVAAYPCASVKVALAYQDGDIADEFIRQYGQDERLFPGCRLGRSNSGLVAKANLSNGNGNSKLTYALVSDFLSRFVEEQKNVDRNSLFGLPLPKNERAELDAIGYGVPLELAVGEDSSLETGEYGFSKLLTPGRGLSLLDRPHRSTRNWIYKGRPLNL
jgi:hypothetical protein